MTTPDASAAQPSGLGLRLRRWFAWRLLNWARAVYPARTKQRVWQIIEVPRRLSETEAQALADQVENL